MSVFRPVRGFEGAVGKAGLIAAHKSPYVMKPISFRYRTMKRESRRRLKSMREIAEAVLLSDSLIREKSVQD